MSYYLNKTWNYFKKDTKENEEEKDKDKKEEEEKESTFTYYWNKVTGYFSKKPEDKKEDDKTLTYFLKNPLEIFKQLDRNGDVKITEEDFVLAAQDLGLGQVGDFAVRHAFRQLDTNHNGVLEFTEALAALNLIRNIATTVAGATALAI